MYQRSVRIFETTTKPSSLHKNNSNRHLHKEYDGTGIYLTNEQQTNVAILGLLLLFYVQCSVYTSAFVYTSLGTSNENICMLGIDKGPRENCIRIYRNRRRGGEIALFIFCFKQPRQRRKSVVGNFIAGIKRKFLSEDKL